MKGKHYIYIVQVTRQLSVDILNSLVKSGATVELVTGVVEFNYQALDPAVRVTLLNKYDNRSFGKRFTSGMWFTIRTFFYVLFRTSATELILVSTPPFVFYAGWLLRKLRGQKYHLIVWDLYPDVLINFSVLRKKNLLIRFWQKLNTWCFQHASTIFTLGKHLAEAIKVYTPVQPVIIPNWVDTSFIHPMEKEQNIFAQKYGLTDKFVILYSGNLGLTHDVESIVYTAKELISSDKIKFVIIGEGSKLQMIKEYVRQNELKNVLILPYQDRSMLPFSLTTADISIVTLSKGAESVSVPSKTYYSLASGSAIFALAAKESELGLLIEEYQCGKVFENYTPAEIATAITELVNNPAKLVSFKQHSRSASMNFSPKNADRYVELIEGGPNA